MNALVLLLLLGAEFPQAISVPPLRAAQGLYNDPLAHSPTDMDGPHENTHGVNSRIRNAQMQAKGGRWNAVYVLRDKAFLIQEPPITLSDVAAAIPANQRGRSYQLYFVTQARDWNDCPLYVMDEFGSYINSLECNLATSTPNNDPRFVYEVCYEFYLYARVLSAVAAKLAPGYDARQLNAVIEYQGRRAMELSKRVGGR